MRPDPPVDAAEVPAAAVGTLADSARALTDLRSAVVESNVGITADQLFAPLQFGLLRGASAANRGSPPAAQDAAAAVLARVDAIRNSIRVLEPPNPYALGSSDAPLPVTVANALPVTVRVRVELKSTSGLRVAPIDVQQVPPLGRRQVSVNAQVTRAGQFTVDAAVSTPDGGLLGPPSHLKVRSTAYGTITAWLTAIAGGLLVLLAARRVWRRVREAEQPAARVAPGAPPTVEQPADPTVRLPIPSHGSGPPDRAPPPRPTPTPLPVPQAGDRPAAELPPPPGPADGGSGRGRPRRRRAGPRPDPPPTTRAAAAPPATTPEPASRPRRPSHRRPRRLRHRWSRPRRTWPRRSASRARRRPDPAREHPGRPHRTTAARRASPGGAAESRVARAFQRRDGGGQPGQPASPASCARSCWSRVLGVGVLNDSYTVSNTLPNIVYELLLRRRPDAA